MLDCRHIFKPLVPCLCIFRWAVLPKCQWLFTIHFKVYLLVIPDVWDQCARARGLMFLGGDGDAAGGVCACLVPALSLPSLMVKCPGANECLALLRAVNRARTEGLKQLPFKNYFWKNAILWAQNILSVAGSCWSQSLGEECKDFLKWGFLKALPVAIKAHKSAEGLHGLYSLLAKLAATKINTFVLLVQLWVLKHFSKRSHLPLTCSFFRQSRCLSGHRANVQGSERSRKEGFKHILFQNAVSE